jgi:hypothetical protein
MFNLVNQNHATLFLYIETYAYSPTNPVMHYEVCKNKLSSDVSQAMPGVDSATPS